MNRNTKNRLAVNQTIDRRNFMKKALLLSTHTRLFVSCIRSNNSSGVPLVPGPEKKTIAFFGDSLTSGTGGTPYGTFVGKAIPDTTVATLAIGGQNSEQICARQGGIPIKLNLEGGAFSGSNPVKITRISSSFLSTPASNQEYTSKGTLVGIECTIRRLIGSSASQVEIYTVTPISASDATIPDDSVFIPEESVRYQDAIQVLWMGRNNNIQKFVDDTLRDIDASIAHIRAPKRYIVLGVLKSANEVKGTSMYVLINQLNDQLKTKYGKNFIDMIPPTAEELKAVNYELSEKDTAEISNGTFPQGLRSDRVHLNNLGYQVIANRVIAKLNELNY